MVDKTPKKDLCIVHIGMPKTGSSALQESLYKGIADEKVTYANLPVVSHSAIIYSMFSSHPETHLVHTSVKRNLTDIEAYNQKNKELLIKGFTDSCSEVEIISGEDIFHLDQKSLNRMKEFLEAYFKRVLIVGYVRSPKSFMESAFQQLVKYHDIHSFDFKVIYPHYKMKLEKFDKVFGAENVQLWKFDSKELLGGDITRDFCSRLDIKMDEKAILRANESLSREAIAVLYASNKFGVNIDMDTFKINNHLVAMLSNIGSNKFKFSSLLMDEVLETHKDDLLWIEKRMKCSLQEEYLYREEDVKNEEDLLHFSENIVQNLQNLMKDNLSVKEAFGTTSKDIAALVDILKIQIGKDLGLKKIESNLTNHIDQEYEIIQSFNLNWSKYFLDNNIKEVNQNPIKHFIKNWRTDKLVVDNKFDTSYYMNKYKDIKKSGINPLIHYFRHGFKEQRKGTSELEKQKVHVYLLCYNEEEIIKPILDYYSSFCSKIFILDNCSTDNSVKIANKFANVTVIEWENNGKLDDAKHVALKTEMYKQHSRKDGKFTTEVADWIIACDMDEVVYHPDLLEVLRFYAEEGITVPQITGFDMVGSNAIKSDAPIIDQYSQATRLPSFDKRAVFASSFNMSYSNGCHPNGTGFEHMKRSYGYKSSNRYPIALLHYKHIGLRFMKKAKEYSQRIDKTKIRTNKDGSFTGPSVHYLHLLAENHQESPLLKNAKKLFGVDKEVLFENFVGTTGERGNREARNCLMARRNKDVFLNEKSSAADFLRELSLMLEEESQFEMSLHVITEALRLRPNGPAIIDICNRMKKKV